MLGFGFNKNKVLANAERYVQQGKLQNAINEYEKIINNDPKDLTVLNTIGDLYARVGQVEQATEYFRKVGDRYSAEGFTVKAIAMYKKLTKLNNSAYDCVQRLAELYTQQGLYSDARQQYLVVADNHMRKNELPDAARIFQRVLELDPENTAMQNKLADLYERLGNKEEARNLFFRSADSLYARGSLAAADENLARVLAIDSKNPRALMLRGQIAMESGDAITAITWIEQVGDIETNPDGIKELLRAYLKAGRLTDAERLARTLLIHYKDIWGIAVTVDAMLQSGKFLPALQLLDEFAERLLSTNDTATAELLHSCIARVKDDPSALELLRKLFLKVGVRSYLNEISELLAHALVQRGDLARARDIYRELAELEPENPLHAQNYRQLTAKLGEDPLSRAMSETERSGALMVDELEAVASSIQQQYPPELEAAISAAITDSELFDSYNLPSKSIAPLEGVLAKAPVDVRVNQRLAVLYNRAGRPKDAARCCAVLKQVFESAGQRSEAREYGDLAIKYAAAANIPVPSVPMPSVLPPITPPATKAQAPTTPMATPIPTSRPGEPAEFDVEIDESEMEVSPAEEFEIEVPTVPPASLRQSSEVDLSADWDTASLEDGEPAVVEGVPEDLLEEVEFYLSQSMWDEAATAIRKVKIIEPGFSRLAAWETQLQRRGTQPPAPEVEISETPSVIDDEGPLLSLDDTQPLKAEDILRTGANEPEPLTLDEPEPIQLDVEEPPVRDMKSLVSDLEESLGDDFEIAPPAAPPKAAAPVPPPAVPAASAKSAPPPPPQSAARAPWVPPSKEGVPAPAEAANVPSVAEEANSMLSDLFAEFKEDVEETQPETGDPETHYNLGMAFKEMGLLDEAIGELQKTCQATDRGVPFAQTFQAYTWLAHCLIEKGVPEAAFRWYEKALRIAPDEETTTAIHYELGCAYESAGKKNEALEHFMEVYGTNIDYRDVAERIKGAKS